MNETDMMAGKIDILIQKQNQVFAAVNSLLAERKNHQMQDQHFEKEFYKDFPTGPAEMPDFKDKFLALVKNMDEESVRCVVLILKRLKELKESPNRNLPVFTEKEYKKLKELDEHFEREIIKLSPDCFYYQGLMLPTPRFEPCVFVDRCGLADVENPEYFEDKDIIDAGAYIGDSALIFSGLTRKKVYAFEPTAENYNNLLKTIKLNDLKNVEACRYALGQEKGQLQMTNAVVSATNSIVEKSNMPYLQTETVNVTTVDEFVKENHLNVGLIKVDVEGAEQLLLAGALETIKNQKPTLLFSIYHNASDFFEIKPILEKLDLGYTFKIRHPVIGTILMETMLIAEVQPESGK